MAIYGLDGVVVGHAHVAGLDSNNGAEFLMKLIDDFVSVALADDREQPKICELGGEGSWDFSKLSKGYEIGVEVVDKKASWC